ncbi:MAG: HDIG domain-containing protein [Oligoflexia bacterium]|nr:HDIG domain-containing protein [Oligoflexia bacterium]
MYIQELSYVFLIGLAVGLLLTVIWDCLERRILLRKTKIEAEHILQEAQERVEERFETQKKECLFVSEKELGDFEKERGALQSSFQELQSYIDNKKDQLKLKSKENRWKIQKWGENITELKKESEDLIEQKNKLKLRLRESIKDKVAQLEKKLSIDRNQLTDHLKEEIKEKWINRIKKQIERAEKHNKQNLQKDSFFQLNQVLNRLDRPYCPERGIKPVSFKNIKNLENLIGENNVYLHEIEKECGVDIVVDKEEILQASIFGIDPVRRELGRMSLQKLSERRKIDSLAIRRAVKMCKKNLFSKIRSDGAQICKKLGLADTAPEVKNMMGALRYRYSFAQNQYFHCEEVGRLCGLLNAELSLPIKPAQRAGLFHDIGKAMDHSIEGNHAVIGAEFLSKYNESKEVLHAVRAHHHDETPSTPLAYLVIVADSISGSRPGARRFTEDSYNQKMANLERIIDSFENIEDAYIMNAGREMRVIVDDQKVSDQSALELSKLIARKIEKECSYPGLIKVTVVRHSEIVATA